MRHVGFAPTMFCIVVQMLAVYCCILCSFGSSSQERAEMYMKLASVHMTILKRGVECSDENGNCFHQPCACHFIPVPFLIHAVTKAEDCLWDAYGILNIVSGSSSPRTMATQVYF